ncbi:hypothetical protein H7X68_02725 [Candidatus Saccharibacteria bacterium]|nr:hypothetical protein [Candidatus Saccharibacteria bacterium]
MTELLSTIDHSKSSEIHPKGLQDSPEIGEINDNYIVERSIKTIETTQAEVTLGLGLEPGSPFAVAETDEALVYIAEQSQVNSRTESGVSEAIEDAVIEGALEQAGLKKSAGKNPITILELGGFGDEINDIVAELHASHATLPNHQEAARVVADAIELLEQDVAALEYTPSWQERSEAARNVESGLSNFQSKHGTSIGEIGFQKSYNVSKIPIALPLPGHEAGTPTFREWKDMSDDEKHMYGYANSEDTIAFDDLSPESKQTMLANRIFEVESKSNNTGEMSNAVQECLDRLRHKEIIRSGDYLHSSNSKSLADILARGLLAGEATGKKSDGSSPRSDRYPYNLDLSGSAEMGIEPGSKLDLNKTNRGYGDIVLVIDRSEDSTDYGNEVETPEEGHKLIFGGIPSTEIRSIHLQPPMTEDEKGLHDYKESLNETIHSLVAHGQYIPVFDDQGELSLSLDEFKAKMKTQGKGAYIRDEYIGSIEESESGWGFDPSRPSM